MNANGIPTCDDPDLLAALKRLIAAEAVYERDLAELDDSNRRHDAAEGRSNASGAAARAAQDAVLSIWRKHADRFQAVRVGDVLIVGPDPADWPADPDDDARPTLYVRVIPIGAVADV